MTIMSKSKIPVRSLPIPPPWPYNADELKAVEETIMFCEVSHKSGMERNAVIRFLNADDLDAAEELNLNVLCRLPHPHILRREGREYFASHLREKGRCLGAFYGTQMIAFTVLSFPRDEPHNLGIDLGFDRQNRLHVCHFELSGVHPDYRGHSLHRTMNLMRARFAGVAGYNHLCGTVSPRNPFSLRNHIAGGMVVRKLVQKYGGMDRYVIYRDYEHPFSVRPEALGAAVRCDCLDIEPQKELLANDYWGVAVDRPNETAEWQVTYVPTAMMDLQ